jgi:hypothetical protein
MRTHIEHLSNVERQHHVKIVKIYRSFYCWILSIAFNLRAAKFFIFFKLMFRKRLQSEFDILRTNKSCRDGLAE